MAKIGSKFVEEMIDRGRRELGAALYGDGTIAQPSYPLHGARETSREQRMAERDDVAREDPPAHEDLRRDDRDEPDLDR